MIGTKNRKGTETILCISVTKLFHSSSLARLPLQLLSVSRNYFLRRGLRQRNLRRFPTRSCAQSGCPGQKRRSLKIWLEKKSQTLRRLTKLPQSGNHTDHMDVLPSGTVLIANH